MASTYSELKIELMTTGENSGTWGDTTNTNLGTALGEAITGSADVTFASADVNLTLTDTNTTQTARNLRLNIVGTLGASRYLYLSTGCNIEKFYLVNNGSAYAVTVQNKIAGTASGSTVTVPAGKSMLIYNTGTNIVDAATHFTAVSLTTPLAVTSGGTGGTTSTGSGAVVLATSPTLVTPALGTPTAGNFSTGTFTWPTFNQNTTGNAATATTATTATNIAGGATSQIPYQSAVGTTSFITAPTVTNSYLQWNGTSYVWAGAAGTTTNAATFNDGGTGAASGTTFDGSTARTISYNTVGASPLAGSTSITTLGTVTTGTWSASTIGATKGGTGQSTYDVGDLLIGGATNTLAKLADVATGNALISGGVAAAPSYGKIGLTTHISGTLAVGNGGTGATTLTGLAYGNGTSAFTAATAAQVVSTISTTAVTNATNATRITNSGGWNITPSGTTLFFNYNGTNVASLDSSGNFKALLNIGAYVTP